MSTILDALRKAQDETAKGGREVRSDEIAEPGEGLVPRRARPRRVLVWLGGILGVLVLAFVGGIALGNRVSDLFLGERQPDGEPSVAARDEPPAPEGASHTALRAESPPPVAADRDLAADEPAERVAAAPVQPAAPAQPEEPRRQVARAAVEQPQRAAAAPAPTPYGQLHVFGADQAPARGARSGAEDRAARLQQLREKMLKARREVAERTGPGGDQAPIEIAIPPAPAAPAAVAPAAVAAAPAAVAAAPAPAAPQEEIRDPDIVFADDDGLAEPPAEEAPAVVAALPPQEPVQPAAPPVLRRAPGGAPQVSINILQWSTEPGRRFAFVSVDGGGMTQVREGDRIGGLTVKHIHQQMIEFGFNDSSFLLRAN